MIRKFLSDRSGNFAIMSALLALPLVLGAGVAVDYARYSASHRHLQELADAAALALAASKEQNREKLEKMANDVIAANRDPNRLASVSIASLATTADDIDLALDGDIPATIMSIAGYDRLPSKASALAERAVRGNVEVALILDNTWSMSDTDAKGVSKIATLKTAAARLVDELMQTEDGVVRIGLVPYADYVNVGTQHRGASWLEVGADYTTTPAPETCVWKDVTSNVCDRYTEWRTCTRSVDGVSEEYRCRDCAVELRPVTTHKEVCSGGGSGTAYKWFGCVGSRRTSDNRLHDKNPSVRYPGYLATAYRCPNPIVTLSTSKNTLKTAIEDMVINRDGTAYRPLTYIPAGLIWGLNVLSPGAPFEDSQAYDERNLKPRKVAVLMTDGENTLRFRSSDGRHIDIDYEKDEKNQPKLDANGKRILTQTGKNQFATVNAETVSICDYMKTKNIEIFSIAFMVEDATAKSMLEDCATDSSHYYDATDSEALLAAFSGIGASLRVVRLAR